MDWDKLRIFHAVAEAGSFTRAGEMLNLSQSAVSRQISTLEESLDVSLFHRHARGLLLTEQGELLQKTAKDIFGKLAMIEGQILDSKQRPEGTLRITSTEFIGATWIAPKLNILQADHPDIQLSLLLDNRIYNLGMREADAAIRLYKPEQQDLIQLKLGTIQFHIYASDEYINKRGKPTSIEDLQHHTLIGYPEGLPAPYADPNWLFRLADIDPARDNNIIMINSMLSIYRAVKNGCGLAMLPRYLTQDDKNLQIILPDQRPSGTDMYFAYPEDRRHSQRIMIFRDFLQKLVSETKF